MQLPASLVTTGVHCLSLVSKPVTHPAMGDHPSGPTMAAVDADDFISDII